MKIKKLNKPTIWKFQDDYKVYTDNKLISTKISKIIKHAPSCLYEELGKVVAWDYIVPADKIAAVKALK